MCEGAYVYEPQQNLERGLCARKIGLSPPPPQVMYYWPFQDGASVYIWFILIVNVRPLSAGL